ncbi:MAG: MFS transporter, partial [Candidatus Limnocylindrales bacterium]
GFAEPLEIGRITFLLSIPVAIISILIQPTVGSISDYTISRWGRRKPYIVIGSLLDLVFLAGIATANNVLILGAFAALLAFSTNIARGPFQGYVPDLVPEKQVGLASAMVGIANRSVGRSGDCRALWPAIVLSSLGFMAHHV